MKRSLLAASLAFAVAIGSIGIVPLAKAAAGDSTIFFMTKSAGAVPCLNAAASGRGTISDLGPVQNMHIEVSNLPANTEFTLFVINTPSAPFVPAWYQGDLKTNAIGRGVVDVTGIFSDETFIAMRARKGLDLDGGTVKFVEHHLALFHQRQRPALQYARG